MKTNQLKVKEANGVNNGTSHLGYKLDEAVSEGIDNSFDAGADIVSLSINEEEVEFEDRKNEIKRETAYSYTIFDNGKGIKDLTKIFTKIGVSEKENYQDIKEYKEKNGVFGYGLMSHINIGEEVRIYTKCKGDTLWKSIVLRYNTNQKKGFVDSEVRQVPEKEIKSIMPSTTNINVTREH